MDIDLLDLRAARPENVRRLARALGLDDRAEHRRLCRAVFCRLARGRSK